MFEYIEKIKEIIQIIEKEDKENIENAAKILEKAVLNKNSIFIFGASHAGILAQEMYYRAGGLMTINPIFAKELSLDREPITSTSRMERLIGYGTLLAKNVEFSPGDVLILHSVSGRNPVVIELALEAKECGVTVIALTNLKYSKFVESRHPSKKKLFEIADMILDNHGEIGDASCSMKGLEQKVGPTSTVIGALLLNTIVVEVAKDLITKGIKHPPVYYSANLDGGDELNNKLIYKYKDSIKYRI